MLAGTETNLTYDIKIELINKPTNLKIYVDEEMKNEFNIENNILQINNFLNYNETSEIQQHIFYWCWPLETGSTEEEILQSDLEDSSFMGQTMSMKVAVQGMQANEDYVTVTYDTNYFENDLYTSDTAKSSFWNANYCNGSVQMLEFESAKYGKCFTKEIVTIPKYSGYGSVGPYCKTKSIVGSLEAGKTYTFSVYIKVSNENVELTAGPENITRENRAIYQSNDEWKRIVKTFVVTNATASNFTFYNNTHQWQDGDIISIHSLELMEGEPTYYKNTIKHDTKLKALITPHREGYKFMGWYTDPVEGVRVDEDTIVTENMTIYARWKYNG